MKFVTISVLLWCSCGLAVAWVGKALLEGGTTLDKPRPPFSRVLPSPCLYRGGVGLVLQVPKHLSHERDGAEAILVGCIERHGESLSPATQTIPMAPQGSESCLTILPLFPPPSAP